MTTKQTNLEQMRNINILDIDPDTIVDSNNIIVDMNLPVAERVMAHLHQSKNPYFMKVGKIIVKIGFSETDVTATDCFARYMKTS